MKPWLVCVMVSLAACGGEKPQLVTPDQIVGDAIPISLTETHGNANQGEGVFTDRERGHCILCHAVNGLDAEFQGNVGPDLTFVGARLNPGQIRLRIVDYETVRPGTLMPSYYRIHDLYQVGEAYEGAPVLSAQEVEDLVSYLSERR
ncbi:MAG: sulfur oxidation c-type cytochrome SoxX [Henriciella sp.]